MSEAKPPRKFEQSEETSGETAVSVEEQPYRFANKKTRLRAGLFAFIPCLLPSRAGVPVFVIRLAVIAEVA